jgi:hypothetical protein
MPCWSCGAVEGPLRCMKCREEEEEEETGCRECQLRYARRRKERASAGTWCELRKDLAAVAKARAREALLVRQSHDSSVDKPFHKLVADSVPPPNFENNKSKLNSAVKRLQAVIEVGYSNNEFYQRRSVARAHRDLGQLYQHFPGQLYQASSSIRSAESLGSSDDDHYLSCYKKKAVASFVRAAQVAEPVDSKLWAEVACRAVVGLEVALEGGLEILSMEDDELPEWMASRAARLATVRRCVAVSDGTFETSVLVAVLLRARSLPARWYSEREELLAALRRLRALASNEHQLQQTVLFEERAFLIKPLASVVVCDSKGAAWPRKRDMAFDVLWLCISMYVELWDIATPAVVNLTAAINPLASVAFGNWARKRDFGFENFTLVRSFVLCLLLTCSGALVRFLTLWFEESVSNVMRKRF